MTHCKIVAMLSECIPLELSLKMRFCKFINSIVSKGSSLVVHIPAKPFSVYCDNLNEYGANFNLCKHGIVNTWRISMNEIDKSSVNVLKEMIDIRDGSRLKYEDRIKRGESRPGNVEEGEPGQKQNISPHY